MYLYSCAFVEECVAVPFHLHFNSSRTLLCETRAACAQLAPCPRHVQGSLFWNVLLCSLFCSWWLWVIVLTSFLSQIFVPCSLRAAWWISLDAPSSLLPEFCQCWMREINQVILFSFWEIRENRDHEISYGQSDCSSISSHMVTGTMLLWEERKSLQRARMGSKITKIKIWFISINQAFTV